MATGLAMTTASPVLAGAPLPHSQAAGRTHLYRVADTGIDIVRMPQRPPSQAAGTPVKQAPPPSPAAPVPPPAASPVAPPANQPPQPQGRVVKVAVKIAAQPKEPQKGWLGVQMDALDLPLALSIGLPNADGVLILEATANGPASQAGMRFGDVVVGLNGRPIAGVNELRQRVASLTAGSNAEIEIWRVTSEGGDFLQTLRRLADSGNAAVMYRLGRLYAGGSGVARDEAEAVAWYRKGAAAGNLNATAALGAAMLDGRGTGKDAQEGLRLLRTAADKDNLEALYRLGIVLAEGKLAGKDVPEAMRLLNKAADAGHVPSMLELALLYNSGGTDGAQQDPLKAALWYRRAADLGSTAGMVNLGFMHQQGRGVDKDDVAAVALYRKAAAEGNPSGIHNLAAMLDSGRGVPKKDPEEAAELMLKALELRNEFSYRQMTQNARAWSTDFRRALQRKLHEAGVYSGRVDGELRESSIAAINAYINRNR